jgi:hypothetical protein
MNAPAPLQQLASSQERTFSTESVMSVGSAIFARSPLTPQLRTLSRQATIVDKGHKETHAPQQMTNPASASWRIEKSKEAAN